MAAAALAEHKLQGEAARWLAEAREPSKPNISGRAAGKLSKMPCGQATAPTEAQLWLDEAGFQCAAAAA